VIWPVAQAVRMALSACSTSTRTSGGSGMTPSLNLRGLCTVNATAPAANFTIRSLPRDAGRWRRGGREREPRERDCRVASGIHDPPARQTWHRPHRGTSPTRPPVST
jgi:hypothetical protein